MDFMALLAVANKNNQMNEKLAEKNKSGFTTNLAPAKRQVVAKPKGVLSESVKAFLQKKEQEEKAKELEAKKKKEALLQIRKDVKHTRKANAMAKRTKDNIHKMENLDEEAIREKERQERLKLEEKRLAMIEKLKESEQSGGRKSRVASVATSQSEPVSDKQRLADKKLMAKYDKDLADEEDVDVKLEVIISDKQILDKDGYRAREEQRRKELQEQYKGKAAPTDLKADKRGVVKQKAQKKDKHKEKHKEGKDKHKEHKSKHKHKHKDKHKDKDKNKHKDQKPVTNVPRMLPKPKFIRPNNTKHVLSFQDLLKLANQKHETVLKQPEAPGKKVDPIPKKPGKKEERPMTQEEKDRIARKQTKEYKEWYQKGGQLKIDKSVRAVSSSSSDDDDATDEPEQSKPSSNQKLKNGYSEEAQTHSKTPPSRDSSHHEEAGHYRERPRPETKRPGLSSLPSRPHKGIRPTPASALARPSIGTASAKPQASVKSATMAPASAKPQPSVKSATMAGAKRDLGGAPKKPTNTQPAHSNPFDRIMGQIKKNHPKPEKKPRRIESDEDSEYDEEMDDFIASDEDDLDGFIDDSEAMDYSSAIRDIFGYDKRKYKDKDEDEAELRNMEVGFAVTMQEEARSAKIGRMEDLADMKMEAEENKRKMLLKKKMKMKMKMKGR